MLDGDSLGEISEPGVAVPALICVQIMTADVSVQIASSSAQVEIVQ